MSLPFYTNEDLSCAGVILACKSHTCSRTGQPMYSESFIAWAKDVMRVFALEAWRLLRVTGNSLKEAYRQLKSQGGATLARFIVHVPMGMSGKKLLRSVGLKKSESCIIIQTA